MRSRSATVAVTPDGVTKGRGKITKEFRCNLGALLTCADRHEQPVESGDAVAHWANARCEADHRCPIRVRLHLMELSRVDTVSQTFSCKIWLQFKWQERPLAGLDVEKGMPVAVLDDTQAGWSPSFSPKLVFQNVVEDLRVDEKTAHARTIQPGQPVVVYSRQVVHGTFSERMELKQFPIDMQRLHIRTVLWDHPEAVGDVPLSARFNGSPAVFRTLKFEQGDCQVYDDGFVQQDAWELYDKVVMKQGLTSAKRNDDGIRFTELKFYVCLKRKLGYYWWNIIMPCFLLVFISFASFFFDAEALADRLNFTLVVLLTLVAFKFVVTQSLPATSYLTYMDMYLVTCFVFVFAVVIQNLVTFLLLDSGKAADFNRISGIVLTAAWGGLHGVLPVLVVVVRRRQDATSLTDDQVDADDKELETSPL